MKTLSWVIKILSNVIKILSYVIKILSSDIKVLSCGAIKFCKMRYEDFKLPYLGY